MQSTALTLQVVSLCEIHPLLPVLGKLQVQQPEIVVSQV